MQDFGVKYDIENRKDSHEPLYVMEIIWADGLAGTQGVNDVYFASADISSVLNFPFPDRYFPYLERGSISNISSKVDPISGVSTIGSMSVKIQDFGHVVSDIIRAAADAGHGLRRQRVEIYLLFKGMDWVDRIKIRTLQVQDLQLSNKGKYTLKCSDIQRNLQKTIFNPIKSIINANIAAVGNITVSVPDSALFIAVYSVAYALSGFVKINDEIMRWTSKPNGTDLTVLAADRGMFGTTASAHTAGDDMQEIIVLNENPITIALRVMLSTGKRTHGLYDTYPAHWGCGLTPVIEVDDSSWLTVGQEIAGLEMVFTTPPGWVTIQAVPPGGIVPVANQGHQFEFVFDKGIGAKKFIEGDILKPLGGFAIPNGDGAYSARAYNDLSNANKSNAVLRATIHNVVKWSALRYDFASMANELWLDYVEQPKLSGKYIRSAVFIDQASKKKWGDAKQLRYKVRGAIGTAAYISTMYQRFQRVMARYSRPPLAIDIELLPREHGIEVGDIVRVTLPVHDLLTGSNIDRAFEVLGVDWSVQRGTVRIRCIAQPERASFWFNGVGDVSSVTISPSSLDMAAGASMQMVAVSFDANGNSVIPPSIVWTASGNVSINANGLVTATSAGAGWVYATVGSISSNTAAINVTAVAYAAIVASVIIHPSVVHLQAGEIQQLTAQAFDSAGQEIPGLLYNWLSDNPVAATIAPASGSGSVITAINTPNNTNITATEQVSGVVSAVVPVYVSPLPAPSYSPPPLADVVYQVGAQITTHGGVGGPHVIPNGYNFPAGDYWYDGDVSQAVGSTCTVNGTVRLFALGTVTINGTVDGIGRGLAGGAPTGATRLINAPGGFIWGIADGLPGASVGLTGRGGLGGNNRGDANASFVQFNRPAVGGHVSSPASPVVQITPILPTDGSVPWTKVSGVPLNGQGSGGGSGGAIHYPAANTAAKGGAGGAGGAGLVIMARGVFIVGTGRIDLRGGNGSPGATAGTRPSACGGGGGGGGSLQTLAERSANGIPNMVVDANRVDLRGGVGGISSGWYVQSNGQPGGTGAFVAQVVG